MRNDVKLLRRSYSNMVTQEELAKAVGVTTKTIVKMERGSEIRGSLMLKVSAFFKKDPREIFFTDDVVYTTQERGEEI